MADRFSPEIALVDPDLASELRTLLPDPDDCLARGNEDAAVLAREPAITSMPVEVAVVPRFTDLPAPARSNESSVAGASPTAQPVTAASRVSAPSLRLSPSETKSRGRASRPRRPGIVRLALRLVTLAALVIPFLAFLSTDSPSTLAPGTAAPAADERAVDGDRLLEWPAASGASLYNVVFVGGQKRVDRWVKSTSMTLPPAPASEARRAVSYRWYVYPVYGEQEGVGFGKLLAQGTIRLPIGTFER